MFDKIKSWCEKNGYQLLDAIPDGWDRYGDGIPSVTTVLSIIKDPGFEYVKCNYPDELKAAAEKGTKTHKDSEDFFNGDSPTVHKQIMKFHSLYDVSIIGQEINYKKDIQGTVDLVGHIGHFIDEDMNIDYKPKNQSKKYFLQGGGYEYLNGLKTGILYLDEKDFKLELVSSGYLELFIELKDYFLTLLANDNRNL